MFKINVLLVILLNFYFYKSYLLVTLNISAFALTNPTHD